MWNHFLLADCSSEILRTQKKHEPLKFCVYLYQKVAPSKAAIQVFYRAFCTSSRRSLHLPSDKVDLLSEH